MTVKDFILGRPLLKLAAFNKSKEAQSAQPIIKQIGTEIKI
jgi:hypothetical protein